MITFRNYVIRTKSSLYKLIKSVEKKIETNQMDYSIQLDQLITIYNCSIFGLCIYRADYAWKHIIAEKHINKFKDRLQFNESYYQSEIRDKDYRIDGLIKQLTKKEEECSTLKLEIRELKTTIKTLTNI